MEGSSSKAEATPSPTTFEGSDRGLGEETWPGLDGWEAPMSVVWKTLHIPGTVPYA